MCLRFPNIFFLISVWKNKKFQELENEAEPTAHAKSCKYRRVSEEMQEDFGEELRANIRSEDLQAETQRNASEGCKGP